MPYHEGGETSDKDLLSESSKRHFLVNPTSSPQIRTATVMESGEVRVGNKTPKQHNKHTIGGQHTETNNTGGNYNNSNVSGLDWGDGIYKEANA